MNYKEMTVLNEWSAMMCGVVVKEKYWSCDEQKVAGEEWCLTDARCRAVFWEWWLEKTDSTKYVQTVIEHYRVKDVCYCDILNDSGSLIFRGENKSIQEAEIACINAIRLSDG